MTIILSVSLQMMSPAVRDLLSRVIIQSDSFMSESYHPMAADQAHRMAARLSSQLGCADLSQLCLQEKETFQIFQAPMYHIIVLNEVMFKLRLAI